MITVCIFINGNPLYTRSARNLGKEDKDGRTKYAIDTGDILWHKRDKGAVELAIKMLRTVMKLK